MVGSSSLLAFNRPLVYKICIAPTKAAWKASNKTPQEGLIDYSCACFADEMSKGTGVVKAQRVCKERVREHYGIDGESADVQ
eukprot:g30503.t1